MSIPKRRLFASFWDSPPPDSPPGHIKPKTILNNFPQSGQGQGGRQGVGEERPGAGRAAGRRRGAGPGQRVGRAAARQAQAVPSRNPWPPMAM